MEINQEVLRKKQKEGEQVVNVRNWHCDWDAHRARELLMLMIIQYPSSEAQRQIILGGAATTSTPKNSIDSHNNS
jgi:hypothetical protein